MLKRTALLVTLMWFPVAASAGSPEQFEQPKVQEQTSPKQEEMKQQEQIAKQEEMKRQELAKQEELKQEQARQEEMKRQELAKQEELKQEQARQEELKKQEQIAKQEELKKQEQIAKQEELRKQEQIAKQEEIKRQELAKQEELKQEQARQEELKKQEEIAKQEELKKQEQIAKQEEMKRQELAKQEELKKQEEIAKQEDLRKQEQDLPKLLVVRVSVDSRGEEFDPRITALDVDKKVENPKAAEQANDKIQEQEMVSMEEVRTEIPASVDQFFKTADGLDWRHCRNCSRNRYSTRSGFYAYKARAYGAAHKGYYGYGFRTRPYDARYGCLDNGRFVRYQPSGYRHWDGHHVYYYYHGPQVH